MRLIPSFTALAPFLILLGSCVGPGAQRPVTRPASVPAPASAPARPSPAAPAPASTPQPAPVASGWQYRPVAPGGWTYRAEAAGSSAAFGPGVADAQLTLRCDRASRRVSLARAGAGAGQGALIVRTSYGAASWPATVSAGAAGQLVAFRAASDAGLDQLAYSRGKIAVEAAGAPMLIVPAWAEISRVIEDCRG
ncbi:MULTISPECIES: hypothetical protein [Sphingobium]|uniref:Lipoprotein n=2 Tax=Sphingobium cupriresistens TaxID=1132417 RepID=A0A0J7XRZ2_9SPHN|nr:MULTISPECIES: hypothetical protein [Sphingobium]KMS53833.1 hypothetical protein V473_16590 [Sphingobium cupriresistens LL01]MBJ7377073.1 hypothetical protein [Sphingobium sp.]RYM10371.1 hypothetical protein EWH12_12340 [Sphingobium cupriresistens]WCP13178.1 hypothetical protein sphantq_01596 [Sphingobium sp. AntQ-1]